MSLPATLSSGIVSIYGAASSGISGIGTSEGDFYFGQIDQVGIYSSYVVSDYVMFPDTAIKAKIIYGSSPYILIDESKILLTELYSP